MQRFILITLLSAFTLACSKSIPSDVSTNASDTNIQTVENFIHAFNDRNLDNMLALVSEDVEWLSINGQNISTETNNKDELSIAMQEYFKGCKSCRSEIGNATSHRNWVNVIEIASWDSKGVQTSQSALSVYEFDNGLIKRVYYFPAAVVE